MSQPTNRHIQPAPKCGDPTGEPALRHVSASDEELDAIDAGIAASFPASDPPSASVPTTLGAMRPRGDGPER